MKQLLCPLDGNPCEADCPDRCVGGKIQSWRDYEDGDQIQVTVDGVTYLVHAADAVLMTEEPK